MDPPKLRFARPRGRAKQGRVGAPSLTHLRGVSRHCIQKKRCFAAEVWDAKGLAVPTLGYESCWRAARSAMRLPKGSWALASAKFFKGCIEWRGGAEAAFERDVGDFFVGGDE